MPRNTMELEPLPDRPMTATLVRAEAADADPDVFGVVIAFPDGTKLQAAARISQSGYLDPERIPRQFADALCAQLVQRSNYRQADGTNWPSVMAAIQRMVFAWNRERRDRGGGAVQ